MSLSLVHNTAKSPSQTQFTEPHTNCPIPVGDHVVYSQVGAVYYESIHTNGRGKNRGLYQVYVSITVYNPNGKNPRTYKDAMLIPVDKEKPCYFAVVTGTPEALQAAKFSKVTFKPKRSKKPKAIYN